MKMTRALVLTVAVLGGVLALGAAPATAKVHGSCATAPARVTELQTRLAALQQRVDARNARLADAGDDQALIAKIDARLSSARHHHDRLATRLSKIAARCPS